MYLTYQEYIEYGGSINAQDFNRYEYAAEKTVQMYSYGRVDTMEAIPEAVKRLMVELIQLEVNTESTRTGAKNIKSFSTDGYSENYGDLLSIEDINDRRENLIRSYLIEETDDNGTPLLYCGVNV